MKRLRAALLATGFAVSMLAGCDKPVADSAPPAPVEVSAEAVGHYCGMLLADHEGPKGQIYLASRTEPVWFSSVRDTIAFLRLPEEARDVSAVYVNDMGKAKNWTQPDRGAWVEARNAWFVVESDLRGGMGAPEAVPFSDKGAAEAFRDRHGGQVAKLDEIPDTYVLGPVDLPPHGAGHEGPAGSAAEPGSGGASGGAHASADHSAH